MKKQVFTNEWYEPTFSDSWTSNLGRCRSQQNAEVAIAEYNAEQVKLGQERSNFYILRVQNTRVFDETGNNLIFETLVKTRV